jgi:hypothetical protein
MPGEMTTGRTRTVSAAPLSPRRTLLAVAWRMLWCRLLGIGTSTTLARSALRRRLGEFLRRAASARLAAILRSAALAGAVAAALAAPGAAWTQAAELSPIELEDIARDDGGFVARGEGEPASHVGTRVADAGDVNGDGVPDLIVGGAYCPHRCTSAPSYVVFGKASGEAVELSEVQAGRGGFAIRGSAEGDRSGSSVSDAGDVNGDGLFGDVVIASWHAHARYPSHSGATYVVSARGGADPEPRFRRGAVRGDEELDIPDAIRLLRYLFLGEEEPPCLDAADVDDSGELDISDGIRVLLYLFVGAAAPPDPGPTTCGPDPTADELECATPPGACG